MGKFRQFCDFSKKTLRAETHNYPIVWNFENPNDRLLDLCFYRGGFRGEGFPGFQKPPSKSHKLNSLTLIGLLISQPGSNFSPNLLIAIHVKLTTAYHFSIRLRVSE